MQDRVVISLVAVDTRPGQLEENLEKIAHWVGRAAAADAQLVLMPELSLTGFIPNHPLGDHNAWLRAALQTARANALKLNSPPIDRLTEIARRHDLLLSVGMLEDAGNVLHNTQLLIGGDGLEGYWRKMHVPMFEMPFYNGGDGPRVADTRLARVGANICFDALLPESTRLLAVQNVEIVLMPFAADPPPGTVAAWTEWAAPAIRARAAENGIFVAAVNYVGHVECAGVSQQFPGGGLVVSPRGQVMANWTAASGECGMLTATLNAAELAAARAEPEYLYRFRRPELYGPLAEG